MNLDRLPGYARVWVYQSNKELTAEQTAAISKVMEQFVSQWQAHGSDLVAGFEIRNQRWLILAVDETKQAATGCSIDSSVHLIQKLGNELGIDFFDRTLIVWGGSEGLQEDRMHDFWAKRKAGIVTAETQVYNTLATDLNELRSSWEQSFEESWHQSMW